MIGTFLLLFVIINAKGDRWATDNLLTALVQAIVPFALLLQLARHEQHEVLDTTSYFMATVSIATMLYASHMLFYRGASNSLIQAIAIIGVMAGFFATMSLPQCLRAVSQHPKAIAIAVLASMSPHIYWNLRLPLWNEFGVYTGLVVQVMLHAIGIDNKAFTALKMTESDTLADFHVYVSTSHFSVRIGSWCSGYEGLTLFTFLLSLFLLLDWKLFGRVNGLWVLFISG